MKPKPTFEAFLVEEKLISADAIKLAIEDATKRKVPLGQVLTGKNILTEEMLAQSLAKYYQVDYCPGPLAPHAELLTQIPAFTLKRFRVIPLEKNPDHVVVATANPGNIVAFDEIRKITKVSVKVVCTTETSIQDALSVMTGESETVTQGAKRPESMPAAHLAVLEEMASGSASSKIDAVLQRSIQHSASDIHFEPQVNFAMIRERIDGILYEVERMPMEQFTPIISRLKLLAGMDIVEKRLAQDGRFRYQYGSFNCEMRSSTIPTLYGEKLVLRLLRTDSAEPSLAMLNLGETREKLIKEVVDCPDGLVLVAGPTGCGKTTSIYAVLSLIDRKTNNLIMLEDPVEYEMPYTNQVQMNNKIGITFESILPNILRQDPDVLMVGEIRDEGTTQMVMRAAISGHLVFSTIHAPNAIQTVTRLMDMHVESHMVVAALKACISQRLLRRLCSKCKQPYEANEKDKEVLKWPADKPLKLYAPKGCPHCHHLGYQGRFVVMEILTMNEALKDAVLFKDQKGILPAALKGGFLSMRDHAIERVIEGHTSIQELLVNCP